MLDFKVKNKSFISFIRLDEKTNDQVMILVRKHKIPKATVLRSLVEEGLRLTRKD